MNTVIIVSYDVKNELDRIKEEKNDKSKDHSFVVKKLVEDYKKKKELIRIGS